MNSKNTWGGKREGSGRKKIDSKLKKKTIRKGKVIYFRLLDDDYEKIEKISKINKTTVNKYIKKIVLNQIK